MQSDFYLDLAASGLWMPIGVDLILHEQPDPEGCRLDGHCLGETIVATATRFRTPLAFPLMDLRIEKEWLLTALSVPEAIIDTYHFQTGFGATAQEMMTALFAAPPTPRMRAAMGAITHVGHTSNLVPVGMTIGPFSLMTKLIDDPITSVFEAVRDPDSTEAINVFSALELGTQVILCWIEQQIEAGAKAICVCEPAFNRVYISPNQCKVNPQLLEMLVIRFHRRMKQCLDELAVDLIFHDCGELTQAMIISLNALDPAILSLGSSCDLPTIASLVGSRTVLFGNLPSRKFYSDDELSADQVPQDTLALIERMRATSHPFILGSECDVLSVPGYEQTIMAKVMAMMNA